MEREENGRQFEDEPASTPADVPAGEPAHTAVDVPRAYFTELPPEYALDDLPEGDTRFWTRRRILLTIIAVVMVVTLLAYMLQGLFLPHLPPPPLPPGPMV